MSNANGLISAPVSFADVNTVLGTRHTDLGNLCTDSNINKWSMFKPESYGEMAHLTIAQRMANKFGLTPRLNDKAKVVMFGYGGTDAKNIGDSGYTIADIIAANLEWAYTKPSGGVASPYRQTDFAADAAQTYGSRGYLHSAREPINGWSDWELSKTQLDSVISKSLVDTIYNTGSNAAEWKLDGVWGEYSQLNCRLAAGSGSYIGGGGGDMIPLSFLLGGVDTENWRIGIGVFISGESKMYAIVSNYPLKYLLNASTSMEAAKAFPTLGTNQFLCKKMVAALGNNNTKTFQAIPIMVRDCIQTVGQLDGGRQTLVALSGNNTQIYSPPSNSVSFNIILSSDTPYVEDVYTWAASATTDGVFIVGRYNTGSTAGTPPNVANVQGLAVFLCTGKSFVGTKTLAYNVTYTYGVGSNRQAGTASGTISITNSDTITTDGRTYVAKAIITPVPAVEVSSISRLTYS